MEFHQLIQEEIDDSWKDLKGSGKCEYQDPKEIEQLFLQTMKDVYKQK